MNKRETFIVLLFIVILFQGSTDLYSASMPAMQDFFSASRMEIQFTITIFLIFYGVGQFVWMFFSEKYNRSTIIHLNLILFIASSFLASISTDIYMLYMARAIQGFAVSALNLNIKAIPLEIYDTGGIKKFFTYFALFWGAGGTLAPFIGSLIQNYKGWQYNFVFLGIYASITLFFSIRFLTNGKPSNSNVTVNSLYTDFKMVIRSFGFFSGIIAQSCTLSLFLAFNYFMSFFIQGNLQLPPLAFGIMSCILGFSFVVGALVFRYCSQKVESFKLCYYATLGALTVAVVALILHSTLALNIYIMTFFLSIIIFLSAFMASENLAITMLYFRNKPTVASCAHTAIHFVISSVLMFLFSCFQGLGVPIFLLFYVVVICMFFVSNQFCYRHMPKVLCN